MKKSKDKKKMKQERHDFIDSAAREIRAALFMSLPESGSVTVSLDAKGYRRQFMVRHGEEALVVRINKRGEIDFIYLHETKGSYINRIASFEEFRDKGFDYISCIGEGLSEAFEEFFKGNIYDIIAEDLSSRYQDSEPDERIEKEGC